MSSHEPIIKVKPKVQAETTVLDGLGHIKEDASRKPSLLASSLGHSFLLLTPIE